MDGETFQLNKLDIVEHPSSNIGQGNVSEMDSIEFDY